MGGYSNFNRRTQVTMNKFQFGIHDSIIDQLFLLFFFLSSSTFRNGISYLHFVHRGRYPFYNTDNSNIYIYVYVIRDDKESIISWFQSQSDLNGRIKESLS